MNEVTSKDLSGSTIDAHPFIATEKVSGRVLVHICCGPCSILPLKTILKDTAEVWGFFHNPNIHPYSEFKKRLEAVKTLAGYLSLNIIYDETYRPTGFIEGVKAATDQRHPAFGERCSYCYSSRLEETAKAAKANGFDYFTSSLLYSKYQNHEEIKRVGIDLAVKYGIIFYYKDFRDLWQEGIDESKALGLYRQKYCGCIYSKVERYSKK